MKKTIYLFLFITFISQFSSLLAQERNELVNEAIFREFLKSESFELCESILKNSENTYTNFCEAFLSKNDKEKIKYYTSFIETNPKYGLGKAYFYRAISHQNIENYTESELDFLKAIELNEDNFYSYFMLGVTQKNLGKLKTAICNFDTALSKDNSVYFIFHLRGSTKSELGNCGDAINDFKKALEIEPNNVPCYLDLAECYFKSGLKEEALESIEEAKQHDKNNEYKIFIDKLLSKIGT